MAQLVMNALVTLSIALTCLLLSGCEQRKVSSVGQGRSATAPGHVDTSVLGVAETDPVVLLEQLNFWHHSELVALNSPNEFANYDVSAETVTWIAEIEERFAETDATITWDPVSQVYIIVPNRN